MPSFRTVRRVPFSPRQMFDLVADVERYPQFLPLCEALAVKSRERDGDKEIVVAQMTVGYMAIRETSDASPWRPIVYPFKTVIPLTAFLLIVQGVAEFLKNLYAIRTGRLWAKREVMEIG